MQLVSEGGIASNFLMTLVIVLPCIRNVPMEHTWNGHEVRKPCILFFVILAIRYSFFYSKILTQCFWKNRNVRIYFENKHKVLSLYKVMKVDVKTPSVVLFQFIYICCKWAVVMISWRLKIHTLNPYILHACFSCIHNMQRNFAS